MRAFHIFHLSSPAQTKIYTAFMHVIIWEFMVREERIHEFISAYAPYGVWARLFQQGEAYLGTELLRSSEAENVFLTIDCWETAATFEEFQQAFGEQYRELDQKFDSYTLAEKKIGIYSESYAQVTQSSRSTD